MEYSEPQDLDASRWMLYHRKPRFDSAKHFSLFCRLVRHHWSRPGASSITGHFIDIGRLGVRVDSSPPPVSSYEPSDVYHADWICVLLSSVADNESVTSRKLKAWRLCDLEERTLKVVAEHEDVSTSEVSRWLHVVRDVISHELATRGMMDSAHILEG